MKRDHAINELNRIIEGLRLLSPETDIALHIAYEVKLAFTTAKLFLDKFLSGVGAEELREGEEICFTYYNDTVIQVGRVIQQNPQSGSVMIDTYNLGYPRTYFWYGISNLELIARE